MIHYFCDSRKCSKGPGYKPILKPDGPDRDGNCKDCRSVLVAGKSRPAIRRKVAKINKYVPDCRREWL